MESSADISIWIAFTGGILSFFSPCVLPLIPSYLTYISGLSFGELKEAHPGVKIRMTVVLHSLVFIAGFASASFQAGLREGLGIIQKVGGALIFMFGVHLSGLFHFGLLLGEKRIHLRNKPTGFIGTLLVGIAFAAGWTPCIGPILGAILALAAGSAGGAGQGILLLSVYSIGLGVPFLLSGLLFHTFLSVFDRFKKHIRMVEIFTGALLMIAGALLFFDQLTVITRYLYMWMPSSLG